MVAATCHPDLRHYGNGLCSACWQRERYQTIPAIRERCKTYWWRQRRKAYYLKHKKRYGKDLSGSAESRGRAESVESYVDPLVKQPSGNNAPPAQISFPSIKNWWLLKDSELPRAWRQEAA